MTGISCIKEINKILSSDDKLKDLVSDRIYPIVGKNDVKYPYVVFGKSSMEVTYNKDGRVYDSIIVDVLCVSKKYSDSIAIAERVRELIELKRSNYFLRITLENCQDTFDFDNDAYMESLTFRIICNYPN